MAMAGHLDAQIARGLSRRARVTYIAGHCGSLCFHVLAGHLFPRGRIVFSRMRAVSHSGIASVAQLHVQLCIPGIRILVTPVYSVPPQFRFAKQELRWQN